MFRTNALLKVYIAKKINKKGLDNRKSWQQDLDSKKPSSNAYVIEKLVVRGYQQGELVVKRANSKVYKTEKADNKQLVVETASGKANEVKKANSKRLVIRFSNRKIKVSIIKSQQQGLNNNKNQQ